MNFRLKGIQALRGFAAVLVVLHHQQVSLRDHHVPGISPFEVLSRGAFGVDIFFPLSGLVMYLTATSALRKIDHTGATLDFAWRRTLRIAPLYWFFTAVRLLILLVQKKALSDLSVWYVLASFLFLPAYNKEGLPLPLLVVGWTLSYEILFYGIITLCIFFHLPLIRFGGVAVALMALIGLVIPRSWGSLTLFFHPIELEFLGGLILGTLVARKIRLGRTLSFALFGAALLFVAVNPWEAEESVLRPLLWGVPGFLLVLSTLSLEAEINWSKYPFLLLLGDASYSLYLIHLFLIPFLTSLIIRLGLHSALPLVTAQLAGCAGIIIISIFFHLYCEVPLIARLSRYSPGSFRAAPVDLETTYIAQATRSSSEIGK